MTPQPEKSTIDGPILKQADEVAADLYAIAEPDGSGGDPCRALPAHNRLPRHSRHDADSHKPLSQTETDGEPASSSGPAPPGAGREQVL